MKAPSANSPSLPTTTPGRTDTVPNYEYELVNTDSGEVVASLSLALPIAQRDALTLRRRVAPASLGIPGAAPDPTQPGNQVLEAYKRLERRLGNNSEFQRRIGHSSAQVKAAWAS